MLRAAEKELKSEGTGTVATGVLEGSEVLDKTGSVLGVPKALCVSVQMVT